MTTTFTMTTAFTLTTTFSSLPAFSAPAVVAEAQFFDQILFHLSMGRLLSSAAKLNVDAHVTLVHPKDVSLQWKSSLWLHEEDVASTNSALYTLVVEILAGSHE
jgi:hypothetical protein